jgi:hypothetical protein
MSHCLPGANTVQCLQMVVWSEGRLLLTCVRARYDPAFLDEARRMVCEEDVGWDGFLDQAAEHAVAPLLYHTLRNEHDLLPPWVQRRLQGSYYHTAFRNTSLYAQLAPIIRTLIDAEKPVLLLKGAPLAQALYRNVALRPVGDVDLLVRRRDWADVEQLLLNEGLEAALAHPDFGDHSVFRIGGPLPIDLEVHSHLVGPPYYRRQISEDWLWEDAATLTINDVPALMLSVEKAAIHSCLHLLQHQVDHLRWVCDIVEMCRQESFDWDALVKLAVEARVVLPVRIALERCRDLLGLPLPNSILEQMNSARTGPLDWAAYLCCLSGQHSPASSVLFNFIVMPGLRPRFAFVSYWLAAKRRRNVPAKQI